MEDDHWSFGPARTSGGITSDLPVATVPAEARTPIPAQRARKGGYLMSHLLILAECRARIRQLGGPGRLEELYADDEDDEDA